MLTIVQTLVRRGFLVIATIAFINACAGDKTRGQDQKPAEEKAKDSKDVCKKILALTDPAPLADLAELPKRFLDSHNQIRKLHNLPNLIWDTNLAQYAERWAQYLKDNNQCEMKHRKQANITENQQFGENLGYNIGRGGARKGTFVRSPEAVVYDFSKECADYDYKQNSCTSGKKCGHYTQVIWEKTQKVGCAMATCDGPSYKELWVCNYDPPGNWVGQRPY